MNLDFESFRLFRKRISLQWAYTNVVLEPQNPPHLGHPVDYVVRR